MIISRTLLINQIANNNFFRRLWHKLSVDGFNFFLSPAVREKRPSKVLGLPRISHISGNGKNGKNGKNDPMTLHKGVTCLLLCLLRVVQAKNS